MTHKEVNLGERVKIIFFLKCQAFSFPYQALAFESSKPKTLLAGGNGDQWTLYCVTHDLYTHLVTTCVQAMTGQ